MRILTGDYLGITRSGRADASARPRRQCRSARLRNRSRIGAVRLMPCVRSFPSEGLHLHSRQTGARPLSAVRTSARPLSRAPWNGTTASCLRARAADLLRRSTAFEALFTSPVHEGTVDPDWIDRYRARRTDSAADRRGCGYWSRKPPKPPVQPNEVQLAALRGAWRRHALRATRPGWSCSQPGWARRGSRPSTRIGRSSGACCSSRIAKRSSTRRSTRSGASARGAVLGHYTGQTKEPHADVLFASIQTLGRREHLERFAPDAFDYVVVDEFHHAAAATYRKLIAHFQSEVPAGAHRHAGADRRRRPARALPAEPRLPLRPRRGRSQGPACRRSTTSACRTRWTTRTSRGEARDSMRRR